MLRFQLKPTRSVERFKQLLERLRRLIQDPAPVLAAVVHPWLVEHFRLQFDTAGSHGGSPWAPLSEEYAAYQESLGDSTVPLETDTNPILEPSFTDPAHPRHVYMLSESKIEIGSSVDWAPKLGTGGVGPFGESFPPRDPRRMTPSQTNDLGRMVEREISRRARRGA